MPRAETVAIDVRDLTLLDSHRKPVPLATLTGVHVLVLMRHRH